MITNASMTKMGYWTPNSRPCPMTVNADGRLSTARPLATTSRQTPDRGHHAQRHDERIDTHLGHEQAVDQPDRQARPEGR